MSASESRAAAEGGQLELQLVEESEDGKATAHLPIVTESGDPSPESMSQALIARRRQVQANVLALLRRTVFGNEVTLGVLSVLAPRFLLGDEPCRALVVGPTGSGKTTLARALAEAFGLPCAIVSVADLAERNWSGPQIDQHLSALARACVGRAAGERRALLVLDELDKCATHGFVGGGGSADYRRGKQESLLSLIQREHPIPYNSGDGRSAHWLPEELFILGTGVFDGLPPGPVTPQAMIDLGLMPELVGRFGAILRTDSPSRMMAHQVLQRAGATAGREAQDLGFVLDVSPTTIGRLSQLVQQGTGAYSLRTACTVLEQAALRKLLDALSRQDAIGTRLTLCPDDLGLGSG